MRVQAYRNLHTGGYSVMSLEAGTYGTVVQHADTVCISNPEFVVQPAGRKRVVKEGRKNVHAFVRGELSDECFPSKRVSYNPYRAATFVDEQGSAVYTGRTARLDQTGAWFD